MPRSTNPRHARGRAAGRRLGLSLSAWRVFPGTDGSLPGSGPSPSADGDNLLGPLPPAAAAGPPLAADWPKSPVGRTLFHGYTASGRDTVYAHGTCGRSTRVSSATFPFRGEVAGIMAPFLLACVRLGTAGGRPAYGRPWPLYPQGPRLQTGEEPARPSPRPPRGGRSPREVGTVALLVTHWLLSVLARASRGGPWGLVPPLSSHGCLRSRPPTMVP